MQGELEITTIAGTGKAATPGGAGNAADLVERVPFLMLALDLPPAPLYKDALEKNIIPQVRDTQTLESLETLNWTSERSFNNKRVSR